MSTDRKAGVSEARLAHERRRALRLLPSVDECLRIAEGSEKWSGLSRAYLGSVVRSALGSLREEAGAPELAAMSRVELADEVIRRAALAIGRDEARLRPVVNATGVVLHTNLGRALLPESAIEAVAAAARSPVNLEYDLAAGSRGDRDNLVECELCALTGAEAATVVNNNAAAVLLALNSLAEGGEVIVSRGELVEIGGSFRIPEIMAKSGARLREVGTTNRTHLRDYERAIGLETALLLKVHPSNYRVVGFTTAVELAPLVELGRKHSIAVMEDLGSGALADMRTYGLPYEPVVSQRVAAGVGIVTFSGDKLMGGPQAGIAVGKRELIEKLKANPLKRALRCGKLTLAALSATLRLYLRSAALEEHLPTLRMLTRGMAELEQAAVRARDILLARLPAGTRVEIAASASQTGSGSLPAEELETRVLRIAHDELSADEIARIFRRARPPVIGRIKDDLFQLDLRTIGDPEALAVDLGFDNPEK